MTSIYLVVPQAMPQAYYGAECYALNGLNPTQLIADLSAVTVAAFVPADFHITLCDEHIQSIDLDTSCDIVALTGKETQAKRMLELADHFRARGKVVVIGGPFASLAPERVRSHCDILVRGEIEEIASQLFADLRNGCWDDEYVGDKPDLALTPPPRWDLYPNGRALIGNVQTSRGCPFECEFCDVPVYAGRLQRHKPVAHVLAELDILYAIGYRIMFLADDNFTVHRQHAKELLAALAWWNKRRSEGQVSFATQVSIDASDDEELLRLCQEAGLNFAFVGLETPNQDSLRETRKRQNLRRDPVERIDRFLAHGVTITSGLIVGFDADGPGIFDQVEAFVNALPIPVFSLGALMAPAATPLRERLLASDRIDDRFGFSSGYIGGTNILPLQMTQTELLDGLRSLKTRIYSPEAFGQRTVEMCRRLRTSYRESTASFRIPESRQALELDTAQLIRRLGRGTKSQREMVASTVRFVMQAAPETLQALRAALRFYAQIVAVDPILAD